MTNKDPRLVQLQAAVKASSISAVAVKIGFPRCTVSLVAREKYGANPENILARFDEVWNGIDCPHLGKKLTAPECEEFRTRKRPSGPLGVAHWRACRHCSLNPNSKNHL